MTSLLRRIVATLVTPVLSAVVGLVGTAMIRRLAARAHGEVVVLDIDNTLADSWPSFLGSFPSQRSRLDALEPLPHIKAVAHDEPLRRGATVVFVSHRNPWEWPVTVRWLRRHGFAAGWHNVVLVDRPARKVPLIAALATNHPVEVWDDLSRGHENGRIEFYEPEIDALAALSVVHHGWEEIVAVTGCGLDRVPSPGLGADPADGYGR